MLLHKFGNFASQLLQQSVQTKRSVLFGRTLFQFIVCENMCNEQRMLKTDIDAVQEATCTCRVKVSKLTFDDA